MLEGKLDYNLLLILLSFSSFSCFSFFVNMGSRRWRHATVGSPCHLWPIVPIHKYIYTVMKFVRMRHFGFVVVFFEM